MVILGHKRHTGYGQYECKNVERSLLKVETLDDTSWSIKINAW